MIKPYLPAVVALATLIGGGAAIAASIEPTPPVPAPASSNAAPAPAASSHAVAAMPDPAAEGEKARKDAEADRAAFFDAHLAALNAGLILSPDQEKLWPAFERAMRGLAHLRETMRPAQHDETANTDPSEADDPIAMLKLTSERLLQRGEAMKALADAFDPLYTSLGEDQKRRLPLLLKDVMPKAGPVARMMSMLGTGDDRQVQEPHPYAARRGWEQPRERGWGDRGWWGWQHDESDRGRREGWADERHLDRRDWNGQGRQGAAEAQRDEAYGHHPMSESDENDD